MDIYLKISQGWILIGWGINKPPASISPRRCRKIFRQPFDYVERMKEMIRRFQLKVVMLVEGTDKDR